MDSSLSWGAYLGQAALLSCGAPLFLGLLRLVKCQLQNRQAPSLLQPYWNLAKLFNKEMTIAERSSWLFHGVPVLIFSTTLLLSFMVPVVAVGTLWGQADFLLVLGLFVLLRFALVLAGLDLGTAFGGLGATRELFLGALAEPVLFMVVLFFAMPIGTTDLTTIIAYLPSQQLYFPPALLLAACALILVALAENGRLPFDNPTTHLELTMIHEAILLEYSGSYLALLEWSAQLKLMIYATLLINLLAPWGIARELTWSSLALGIGTYGLKLAIVALLLGFAEISLAKLRLFRLPGLLSIGLVCAGLALLLQIMVPR